MALIFKQIVYCNDNSIKNFPQDITAAQLVSGNAFKVNMASGLTSLPIAQLGVQAPPGTKFYINNSSSPVIIGFTGLFEIDLTGGGSITNLHFDATSLDLIKQNDSAILIIDLVYIGGAQT